MFAPDVKNKLKNIRLLNAINITMKRVFTQIEYKSNKEWYKRKSVCHPHYLKPPTPPSSGKPAIFFLGTDKEQDTSGIIQALQKIGQLTFFTKVDGAYGHNINLDVVEKRRCNASRLLQLFDELHKKGQTPQILISQTWGGYIDPGVFTEIKKKYGSLCVNIAMDDRHQFKGKRVNGIWSGTKGLIGHIDYALTAAPECVEWYEKEGCPGMFFPEASDPNIFHPMPHLEKKFEVSFIGAKYGIRERLVKEIKKAGIPITAFGTGWENGRLPTEETPTLFAQSKIVLGVGTIGYSDDFYSLKMRDFDGPMSGSCYVTGDNPDLYELYIPEKELVLYKSVHDCITKIKWLLNNEDEREKIAQAGRARALADHTWQKRFETVFKTLGIWFSSEAI